MYGYGNPAGNVYGYPYSYDNSTPPPADNEYPPADSSAPIQENPAESSNAANLPVPVLIYMNDGSVYSVRDYWFADGQLHYVLMDGEASSVSQDQVDLPRTNDENAKSGVKFILKSDPDFTAPAPDRNVRPPAQPGSEQPSAQPGGPNQTPPPSQEDNVAPQPEGQT